jgi:hypothetical protein
MKDGNDVLWSGTGTCASGDLSAASGLSILRRTFTPRLLPMPNDNARRIVTGGIFCSFSAANIRYATYSSFFSIAHCAASFRFLLQQTFCVQRGKKRKKLKCDVNDK